MNLNVSPQVSAAEHAQQMQEYIQYGEAQALAMNNRGPIRFDAEGNIRDDILNTYWDIGFYVFKNVVKPDELAELRADFEETLSRAPVDPSSDVDAQGRPAIGKDLEGPSFDFAKPLSDPFGGTDILQGRHQVKLIEPTPAADAPAHSVVYIRGTLRLMESCLRLYGHPELLAVTEAVNGPDFTPFNDGAFIKDPGLGSAVAWHQDGTTHWDSPSLHDGSHGLNIMVQLYTSTGGNGVWVVPGTHKLGKVDIKELVSKSGTERIEGAVPLVCEPGDVVICNRQTVHGSFANTSPDRRVTFGFGFHPLSSVLNVTGNLHRDNSSTTYDEAHIRERSRMISIAIDARKQRYPDETSYIYQPLVGDEENNRWNADTWATVVKSYPRLDINI